MPMRHCTDCNKVKSWPRGKPEPECHCKQGLNPPTVEKAEMPEEKHFGGEGVEVKKTMRKKYAGKEIKPETDSLPELRPDPDGD